MTIEEQLKEIIAKIKISFPFPDYVKESDYHFYLPILKILYGQLETFENKRFLDIGSGPMNGTSVFQHIGFDCFAVDDLSDPWHKKDKNIDKIIDYAKNLGITFYHQNENCYSIPFDKNNFDVVVCFAVIEHLHESPRGILNTMGEMVKDDGIVIVSMPNSVNLRKRLDVVRGKTNYVPVEQFYHSNGIWRGHVREYTLNETIYICRENGFEVVFGGFFETQAREKLSFPLRQIYAFISCVIPSLKSGHFVVCKKPMSWVPKQYEAEKFRKFLASSVPKGIA